MDEISLAVLARSKAKAIRPGSLLTDTRSTLDAELLDKLANVLDDKDAEIARLRTENKGIRVIIKTAEQDRDRWCMEASALRAERDAARAFTASDKPQLTNAQLVELERQLTDAETEISSQMHQRQIDKGQATIDIEFKATEYLRRLVDDAKNIRAERDAARDSAKEWERIAESQLVGLRIMQEVLEEIRDEYPKAAITWAKTKAAAALSRLSSPGASSGTAEE